MAYQLEKGQRAQGANGGRHGELARREMLSPFSALADLRREIDRAFEHVFGEEMAAGGELPVPFAGGFSPKVDVKESDREIRISAELPGVDQKDVSVEISEGELMISGEKRQEREEKEEGWRMVERSYGSFRRIIALPEEVDQNAIRAQFRDGVLTVTVPKTAEAQGKRKKIEISGGSR